MKDSYGLKIGLGLLVVIILAVLEMMFGLISGTSGMIPIELDPTVKLVAVAGVMTVFMLVVFLYIKKQYMK